MPDNFFQNVFINCPFDAEYLPLLRPLVFTILYLGYHPNIAKETSDSGEVRFYKICELIEISKISIHDLSRIQSTRINEIFRLNMPFELGLDIGCRKYQAGPASQKKCLILEKEKYRYMNALSDIAGLDIKNHNDEPEDIVRQIRNWFVENEALSVASATRIWESFNEFMAFFYQQRKADGFKDKDLEMMPVREFINFIKNWLIEKNLV
jgi:hypothetical protein